MTLPHFVIISPFKRTGPLFEQFRMPFTQEWFIPRGIKIGLLVQGEKIFFPNINTCKYDFPYCGPSRLLWTILNLHYIRKLSCKYDSFWHNNSQEQRILNDPTPVCTISGNFHVNLNFDFYNISTGKKSFPYCGLTWHKVTMLFTNLRICTNVRN
jgi:hypothetical protein